MPRKSNTRKTAESTDTPKNVKAKTSTKKDVKDVKKVKKESKKDKKEVTQEDDVSDVEVNIVEDETEGETETETETDSASRKKRVAPTKESVLLGFDDLVTSIEEEITRLRESTTKSKGVKYLRSLGKKVKNLRSQSARVMKQKTRVNRKNNNNSGFLKPVGISQEMAKFTGWDPKELKSRVDVTKYICKYIKDNELQNPADRRQIRADPKLSKLLKYDPKENEPLTYYRLQTHMKPHFIKIDGESKK
jgi:upstream activation factor subunit UAF30